MSQTHRERLSVWLHIREINAKLCPNGEVGVNALVSRWGNSLDSRIPQEIATRVGLADGSRVEIEVRDGQVIIGRQRPRYKLADLPVGVTPHQAREAADEIDWGADRR